MIVSEQFYQLIVMVLSGIAVGFIIDSIRLIVFQLQKVKPSKVDDGC